MRKAMIKTMEMLSGKSEAQLSRDFGFYYFVTRSHCRALFAAVFR